jgi:hypothetical protein
MVSNTTATTINNAVEEIADAWTPVNIKAKNGTIATSPRKIDPPQVILVKIRIRYS